MEWLVLIMLIIIGFILLVLEFLVIPGVGLAGILGLVSIGAGIYVSYSQMGTSIGNYTLLGTALCGFAVTYLILRSKTWRRLQLDTRIDSTVEGVDSNINEGDIGKTQGRLAPMGKVRVGDTVVEAESRSGYIDTNQEVEVIKVLKNKIIVKLKTEIDGNGN